ncbi:sre-6 [Pristionchus pacificus]|uniref:Sre-6 n=1 Tax=Pristionchus pacificus TaxID=54126 RepID=A0A2A6CP53_PRIPA|nr:sre-6 [Pristionchus pacificus]|eukprot:PDM79900.1 sre-6 [Pristionchus pacificus]
MRNPFLVHINSTIIEMAPKTFKLIFAIEFISMALFLMCVPFLLIVLKRSKGLHRNFRVCLFSMCLHYTTASVARCVLFYYQLNDCELSHDDIVLVLAHLARDTVFGYFCAMPGSFAFERFIATRYWKWYENSGPSTLLIIPLVEANNIIPSLVNSYCWTFAMYSQELNFAILIVTLCAGLLYFFTIKRCNLRIMNKITCRLDAYSLAHNYQIRENIRTLKLIGSLLKAAGLLNGMAVLLFSLFEYTSGLISRLAFAMFDMWVTIIAVLYVITLVYHERSFYVEAVNLIPIRKLRRALMPHSVSHSEPPSVAAITRTYFDNLHNAWNT